MKGMSYKKWILVLVVGFVIVYIIHRPIAEIILEALGRLKSLIGL